MNEYKKKIHKWSSDDDDRLKIEVEKCKPIFEHFEQNKSYTRLNAWDAVAGRLLPEICVTGAACMRRWQILSDKKRGMWDEAIEMVDKYERELAETTFDGVSEILGNMDALHDRLEKIEIILTSLEDIWK